MDCSNTSLISPKNVHRVHEPQDLVELAKSIQISREFVRSQAIGKLSVIAEQMKSLEVQARNILEKSRFDDELHNVACNMKKIPGQMYHLYQKPNNGQKFFSLISPSEWGASCPNTFLGSYRLEHDRSWTPDEDIRRVDNDMRILENVLNKRSMYEAIQN